MKTLSIDIETFSSCNLQKSGVYRYVEAPDFEILLFGYSVDAGPVKVIDLACGEKIPDDVLDALTDETVIKSAFNAAFERICLSEYLKRMGRSLDPFHDNHPLSTELAPYLNPESWRCSMIWAATMGLPLSLEGVGAVLGLEKQKLTEGKELIKLFCQPCAPTKANNGRTRNRPEDEPVKWAAFKRYNVRDVETEMSIQERLQKFPVPDFIWDEYHIDQEINDRGVMIDLPLVRQAIDMDTRSRTELTKAMKHLTELDNPNSVQQMKQWLSDNGMETDSLGKKVVAELIKGAPPELQRVLVLRQQLAKSSVKKYQSMVNAVCADGRARGMFQFYGSRTGRWAGRLIQMQNLPQNHLPDLAEARALVRAGDYDSVEMLYEDVPDTLSQLIRTAFIPKDGNKFIVSDFSAIEARVIAWLAGEAWRQEVFAKGGDIYCASASQMFKVPVEKHGINGHLRQKGKIAELALGYGGSVGALKAMGAIEMGLTEDELPPLVEAWRQSNPHIVISEREELLAIYESYMAPKLATEALEQELAELEAEINIVSGLIDSCIQENARVAIDQAAYQQKITALEERQSAAIAKKEKTAKEIARRKARRQEIELHFQHLREMDLLTEFRDEDWISMVDHVTVHAKGDIWVTFRDGSEIKAGTSNG